MNASVLALVAERYGLQVNGCTPVASVYRPAAVFRLETDAGPLCLKPFRYPERRLLQVLAGLDHLARRGFRRLAPVVVARDGSRYFRQDDQLYLVSRWIEGSACDLTRSQHRRAAADSLGTFHAAARGCARRGGHAAWPERYARVVGDLEAMAALAAAGPHPATPDVAERERCERFDRLFLQWLPPFLTAARAAAAGINCPTYRRLAARAGAQAEFCHGDFVAPNLVIDSAGTAVLIDLDTWRPELRLYDLAKLVANGAFWRLEAAGEILAAYAAHLPLCPEERALLPLAIEPPREFWWAGTCRYRRRHCDAGVLALLELAIASHNPKLAFLRELRAELRA